MSLVAWLRRPWVLAVIVLVVGALALSVLALAPFFRVQHVEVSGTDQVSADDVLAAADVSQGRSLMTAPLDEIAARVETLDAVASASVTRDWPNRIQIVVRERRPIGFVVHDSEVALIGSDGSVYREQRQRPGDVPQLPDSAVGLGDSYTGTADESALAAYDVAGALPATLRRAVDSIEAAGTRSVRLVFGDGVVVEWGSAAAAAQKAAVVKALRQQRAWGRAFTVVDVSVPEAPAFR